VAKLSVYDIEGRQAGEVSVDTIPENFKPDNILIARSLKRQLTNARIPCAHAKTRAEVSGGGRKPFKQKGTGRARQGSTRAIQWRGGGVAFGPRPERNWTIGMNKKERKAALRHIIWSKIQDGDWLLCGDLGITEPSTKTGKGFIQSLGRKGKVLVVLPADEKFEALRKSLRNLPEVTILAPDRLNTFDLLKNPTVVIHEKAFDWVRATWQV
jgi:large subunit ribosomal protein L4